MIPELVLSAHLVLLTAAGLLVARLRTARRELIRLTPGRRDSPVGAAVYRAVARSIDESLLPDADYYGLASLPVLAREPHDDHADVAALIKCIADRPRARDVDGVQRLAKLLLQLAASLHLDAAETAELLAPVTGMVTGMKYHDREVATVDRIAKGDAVDRAVMTPITPGARVRWPIGVVLRDGEGDVISRAKVVAK